MPCQGLGVAGERRDRLSASAVRLVGGNLTLRTVSVGQSVTPTVGSSHRVGRPAACVPPDLHACRVEVVGASAVPTAEASAIGERALDAD
ncbi:hypothetical protein GCM10009798_08360 [Nocardioides panacihumi]|uniref:Uncharacterized protein n=1 Tax=Nocardioides panacihumi TaxID=400774 RepID=A0ABN2QGL7_9ACTN